MYVSDLARGLLRRWYIVVMCLVLTGIGALRVFEAAPVPAEANATMLLLPPQETLSGESANPYLMLGGMTQALAVLTTRLNSPTSQEALLGEDPRDSFEATADTVTGAPFLVIRTHAETGAHSLGLLADVQQAARDQLASMQQELSIPPDSIIGIMEVTTDIEATALTATRLQLTLGTVAVGLVLTLVVGAVTDGVLVARRQRREAATTPPEPDRTGKQPLAARTAIERETRAASLRPRRRR